MKGDILVELLWGLAFWAIGLYFLYLIIKAAIDASQTAQNIREIKDILRTIDSRSLTAGAKPQDDRLKSDDINI